jgi:Winged helix DNA-binding domain
MLSAAELSIGRRIAGATRADVQRALWQERTLVKTFGPRGTIHLLPTADLPMWTGALSARPPSVPMHPEGVRFTGEQAEEVIAAIGAALADTELTAPQRRQLDDEADLVAAVMEATATLTVGAVTVGPHA